jgi:two-component system nitrate/nitrite response regulator NarL
VIVADPEPIYAQGLGEAIAERPGLEVVARVADLHAAIEAVANLAPEVAVVELKLLEGADPGVIGRIAGADRGTAVVLLCGSDHGAAIYEAVQSGAAGCLSKETDTDQILDGIAAAARGGIALCPRSAESIAKQIRLQRQRDEAALSQRERDILRLIANGLSSERVGSELALSQSTVKNHLSRIYAKLGVTCAAAAVSQAFRLELLS